MMNLISALEARKVAKSKGDIGRITEQFNSQLKDKVNNGEFEMTFIAEDISEEKAKEFSDSLRFAHYRGDMTYDRFNSRGIYIVRW